jgi:hypothetical protein
VNAVKIYDTKGNCLKTFDVKFTNFYNDCSQIYMACFENNVGQVKDLENTVAYECDYRIHDFIIWDSKILTSQILLKQYSFLRRVGLRVVACLGNSIQILDVESL